MVTDLKILSMFDCYYYEYVHSESFSVTFHFEKKKKPPRFFCFRSEFLAGSKTTQEHLHILPWKSRLDPCHFLQTAHTRAHTHTRCHTFHHRAQLTVHLVCHHCICADPSVALSHESLSCHVCPKTLWLVIR